MYVVDSVHNILGTMDWEKIKHIADTFIDFRNINYTFYIFGNGGSESIAEHFTTDLNKIGINARAPMSNVSLVTMVANDCGYHKTMKYIMSRTSPLEPKIIIVFSVSGISRNVVELIEFSYIEGNPLYIFTSKAVVNTRAKVINIPHSNPYVVESVFSVITHQLVYWLTK